GPRLPHDPDGRGGLCPVRPDRRRRLPDRRGPLPRSARADRPRAAPDVRHRPPATPRRATVRGRVAVRPAAHDAAVGAMREELRMIGRYEARHRRLLARLALVVFVTLAIDLVAAGAMLGLEHDAARSELHTYWDAFFFTTVQLLTVSSQIRNPVTTGG